jgi:hypothetical protein
MNVPCNESGQVITREDLNEGSSQHLGAGATDISSQAAGELIRMRYI